MEDKIIALCFAVQNMSKKMSQSTVFCQRLKESGLKCTATNQDIKSDTVIKNTDTVFCMWRNDADIAFMQSMLNSLNRGMSLAIINT